MLLAEEKLRINLNLGIAPLTGLDFHLSLVKVGHTIPNPEFVTI
jgi:hypothetical protein